MTHTDVSEDSQSILDTFSGQSLLDSVISCIGNIHHKDNLSKSQSIIDYLQLECEKLQPGYYLEESTSAEKIDPVVRVTQQLVDGWKTGGGLILPLTEPPVWADYSDYSRNVRYKIHSWVMLDSLLLADSLTDGNEYLDYAISIADDWINAFVIAGNKDDFAWYDMAVGQRATKLSYMLRRLIEIEADDSQIMRFILAARIHFSELMDVERIALHSNHGLFQMAGLLSISVNLPWITNSNEGLEFARTMIETMLKKHFADDGLHLEHSPDYHLWMVNHLLSLKNSGWLKSQESSLSDLVDSLEESANWMATVNFNVIPIGDSANNVLMTKRWRGFQGHLNMGYKFFPIGGLLIHNSRTSEKLSQLVFSAQFHSRQHKHADHLNVLYNLFEQPLLVDPGTFTYQYDVPERMYCESTRGHNTVEIDGLNYSRFRQDAFGTAITLVAKAGDCIIAEGKVNHTRLISSSIPNNKIKSSDGVPVEIQHRRIVIERPGLFLAIIDEIISDDEHEYTPWYHFHPDLKIRRDTATKLAVINEEGQKYCQIQCYDNDSNSIDHIESKGQTAPNLQGWYSRNGRELIENTALGFPLVGSSSMWATVFDFNMQKTGKPYLRMGTGGKYLRFALTQENNKVDVKIKINKDETRSIEVEIDNSPVDVDIEFDEG
jgi:hypothetical protein